MKRVGRLFFLLTFAFLQCVSPLAHAHLGGDASLGRFHVFHFHDAPHKQSHDHGTRALSGGHSHSASDLPVVKVPDGKRRTQASIAIIAPALDLGGIQFAFPVLFVNLGGADAVHPALPFPYFTQPAQAPPQCA